MSLRYVVPLLPLLLVGCSQAPDHDELSKAVERHIIHQPWQLDDLNVTAESELESGNTAHYQYNIEVEIKPAETLYLPLFELGDYQVVDVGRKPSSGKTVFGLADAENSEFGWQVTIAFEQDPFGDEGKPLGEQDLVLGSDGFQQALEAAKVEVTSLEKEVADYQQQVQGVRQSHQSMMQELTELREHNRKILDRKQRQFDARRIKVEQEVNAISRKEQRVLNSRLKQKLISLNAKFEQRISKQEKTYQQTRKDLDKALIDNDRDYNRMVKEVHRSYQYDIQHLDPNSVSSDEYHAYHDARKKSRDKSLAKLKQERDDNARRLAKQRDGLLGKHKQQLKFLADEKAATLKEGRLVINKEKEQMLNSHQELMDGRMAELDGEFEAYKSELLAEEKALAQSLKDMARKYNELETVLVSRQGRLESLQKGLKQAEQSLIAG